MEKYLILFFVVLFACLQAASLVLPAHAGGFLPRSGNSTSCCMPDPGTSCLHVVITGIKDRTGVIRMALYDSEKNYDARKDPCRSATPAVTDGRLDVVFNNLKPGWYAVLLYHDADNNNRFDRLLGIPMERFGFSNNAGPEFAAPPDFQKTRFLLESDRCATVEIHLRLLM